VANNCDPYSTMSPERKLRICTIPHLLTLDDDWTAQKCASSPGRDSNPGPWRSKMLTVMTLPWSPGLQETIPTGIWSFCVPGSETDSIVVSWPRGRGFEPRPGQPKIYSKRSFRSAVDHWKVRMVGAKTEKRGKELWSLCTLSPERKLRICMTQK